MSVTFSVIIPAFNAAASLRRAIDSVLGQTFRSFEVIVVDDGSSDHTSDVARSYGNAVRLLTQDNQGVAVARNHGAASATGDWLTFLDADDWYYATRLHAHGELIRQYPGLELFTADYDYINESGAFLGASMEQHPSGRSARAKAAGEASTVLDSASELESFVADHFGDTHTLTVRAKLFNAVGGYPSGFKVCEDVHLLIRLVAKAKRIGVSCQSLAAYFIHGESATRRDKLTAQLENIRTLKDLKSFEHSFSSPINKGLQKRMRHARLDLASAYLRNGRRIQAVRAVAPSLIESPGVSSMRDILSVVRG